MVVTRARCLLPVAVRKLRKQTPIKETDTHPIHGAAGRLWLDQEYEGAGNENQMIVGRRFRLLDGGYKRPLPLARGCKQVMKALAEASWRTGGADQYPEAGFIVRGQFTD